MAPLSMTKTQTRAASSAFDPVVLRFGPLGFKPSAYIRLQSIRRLAMPMSKRAAAEFFGTFWLVFGGCGAAVLAAGFPAVGIGFAGVALAFGLTVLTMVYAVGQSRADTSIRP
jgi:hypothetical protein